jgi:uncharacterized delta-60 repeat protein
MAANDREVCGMTGNVLFRRLLALASIGLALCWPQSSRVVARPGFADLSFGRAGVTTTDFGGNDDMATAVAVQADGKIVVAGFSDSVDPRYDFALARYDGDGTLDTTFGIDGRVTTAFFGYGDLAYALAIQPDGKIVAAGTAYMINGYSDFALARYNKDGSLDKTFGDKGKITTDFYGGIDDVFGLVIQPDGKIIAVGRAISRITYDDFALARYNPDGSLDETFGTGGKVVTDFFGINDQARTLALQPDGCILVAGTVGDSVRDFRLFALARYLSDGSLDRTFGGGKITTDLGGITSVASAVAVQKDGKIVLAGTSLRSSSTSSSDFALVRYDRDGAVDSGFGEGGLVTADLGGGGNAALAMAIQKNGKIVVAGQAMYGLFALARYNDNGSIDSTFGVEGRMTIDFGGTAEARAVTIQGDGKLLAAGRAYDQTTRSDFALVRYAGDPGPELSFDVCLRDDQDGSLLQFNSTTGDYQFDNCGKQQTLSGRGRIKNGGCKIKLRDNRSDRELSASVNLCKHVGSASLDVMGKTFIVSDGDTRSHACVCR